MFCVGLELARQAEDALQEGFACFSLQSKPHLVLLRPQFYRKRLKPLLFQWVLLWLRTQQPFRVDMSSALAADLMPGGLTLDALLALYLDANHSDPTTWAENTVRAMVFVRSRLSPPSVQLLNLAKGTSIRMPVFKRDVYCWPYHRRLDRDVHSSLPIQAESCPLWARPGPRLEGLVE